MCPQIPRFKYGYDLASNRTWRENALTHGTGNKFDEFYTYDGLDRLTDSKRGTLTGGPPRTGIDGTAEKEEAWTLDALGNWPGYVQKTAGTADLEQTRVHNKVNEIDTNEYHADGPDNNAITEGQGQPAWVSPKYDAAGNMTGGPRPGSETTRNKYVYDAWNRMVKVTDANDVTIAEYRYNGLNRRIAKTVRKVVEGNERWDRTDYYYNESWQVVEERFGLEQTDKDAVATAVKYQYVWDIRYIDAPVCRDENKNSDGDCIDAATGTQGSNTGDEHLYYCQDANFNVTALVDGYDGAVVERYLYDPYGKVSVRHGVRDAAGGSTAEWGDRGTSNTFANDILYCGYRFDPESGLYHVRHRYYHPTLGRWITQDPIGYRDSANLYQYAGGAPCEQADPLGKLTFKGVAGYETLNNPNGEPATTTGCDSAYWQIHLELGPEDSPPGFVLAHRTDVWDVKDCDGTQLALNHEVSFQYLAFNAKGMATPNWRQSGPGGALNQYALQFYNEKIGKGGNQIGDCTKGSVDSTVVMRYFHTNEVDSTGTAYGFGNVSKRGFSQKPDGSNDPATGHWLDERPPTLRFGTWSQDRLGPADPSPVPADNPSVKRLTDMMLSGAHTSTLVLRFSWKWNCCGKEPQAQAEGKGEPKETGRTGQRRTEPPRIPE